LEANQVIGPPAETRKPQIAEGEELNHKGENAVNNQVIGSPAETRKPQIAEWERLNHEGKNAVNNQVIGSPAETGYIKVQDPKVPSKRESPNQLKAIPGDRFTCRDQFQLQARPCPNRQ
jgi:hypothetical protein